MCVIVQNQIRFAIKLSFFTFVSSAIVVVLKGMKKQTLTLTTECIRDVSRQQFRLSCNYYGFILIQRLYTTNKDSPQEYDHPGMTYELISCLKTPFR